MQASFATLGNEYMVSVILRGHQARKIYKGVCIGWNHQHEKVLFRINDGGLHVAVAIAPTEIIQSLE